MIGPPQGARVYLACGVTDMRKGIDGLAAKAQEVLQKRRSDLTDADALTMRQVVDMVHAERGVDMEPTAGQQEWRRSLMTIGHDPLKPA